MTMTMAEITEMEDGQLLTRLEELRGQLHEARSGVRFGTESNHAQLKGLRRDVARIKTVLRRRELELVA